MPAGGLRNLPGIRAENECGTEMIHGCRAGLSRLALSFIVLAELVTVARAQAPDPADIAAGMRLFRQKGNCQACHGWAGDGRKMDSQMPDGANLRASVLDREALVMIIKCGRPGTGMPAFDKFAYSDGRCYGLKQADLKATEAGDARSARHPAGARDRGARRFHARQNDRQGAHGPRKMRGLLGRGRRTVQRVPEAKATPIASS